MTANEPAVLDALRAHLGLPSDNALARWLGIDRTAVYAIRRGKCKLSPAQRVKILDGVGFCGDTKIADILDPDALTTRLLAPHSTVEHPHPLALIKCRSPDARLLEVCKRLHRFRGDPQLAAHLQVTRQFVTGVRAGNYRLSVMLRLRLLAEAYPLEHIRRLRTALTAPAGELVGYLNDAKVCGAA